MTKAKNDFRSGMAIEPVSLLKIENSILTTFRIVFIKSRLIPTV